LPHNRATNKLERLLATLDHQLPDAIPRPISIDRTFQYYFVTLLPSPRKLAPHSEGALIAGDGLRVKPTVIVSQGTGNTWL